MKELTLNGRTYLTTKRAAEITGYTTDYVGQLARGGKVDAQLVGRNWYISEDSIKKHKFGEAQVSIQKEEEETPAPRLEVLVSSAGETLEKEEEEDSIEEPILINKREEDVTVGVLDEMQGAWQDWYKAQRSVPEDAEEVFLSKEEIEDSVEIPITKIAEIEEEVPAEEVPEIDEEEAIEEQKLEDRRPVVTNLPAQRSWAGTGLVLAGVMAIFFVGVLTITAGYVLTKGTDTPVAAVYSSVGDYILGIQRID